jgi:hypothetical protein
MYGEHLSASNNIIEEESICSSHHSYSKIKAEKKNKYPSTEIQPKNKSLTKEEQSNSGFA